MKKAGFFKKLWSEALPFVARSPEMKVDWLVGVFRKKTLSCSEIVPYMHLLLSEYKSDQERSPELGGDGKLAAILRQLPREVVCEMIRCTSIYDLPVLLQLLGRISVDEAVLALRKTPPVYEKKSLVVLDRLFQAVNDCGEDLLARAAVRMADEGVAPDHFTSAYERFKEILMDEKILSSLYPQAKT